MDSARIMPDVMPLIVDLIKGMEIIYNRSHPDYYNKPKKNKVWTSIRNVVNETYKCNMTVDQCRRKWRTRRDALVRHVQKNGLKLDTASSTIKSMDFMLPFIMGSFETTSEEDSVQNQDVAYITLSEDNNSSEMIADDDDYEMPTISHVTSIPEMPSTEPHMVSVPMQNFERIAAPKAYTNASASSTPQPAATPNRPNPPSTKSNTNDNQSQTGVAEMDENEIFGELVIREMRKMSCDAKKTFKRNVTQLLYS